MSISFPVKTEISKAICRSISGRGLLTTQRLINTLFGNGEQGVFYVPQPVIDGQQVLFQDAVGTVPVTSDGDPVGLMLDLSGNGNHATQATSAARPIYRTDGELHWLEFDGVDDWLGYDFSSAIQWPVSIVQAADAAGVSKGAGIISIANPKQNTAGIFSMPHRNLDGTGPAIAVYSTSGYEDRSLNLMGSRFAFSTVFRTSAQTITDSSRASDSTLTTTEPLGLTALGINALRRNTLSTYSGLFFGTAVVIDDIGAKESNALSYFANLSGVQL